MIAYCTLNALTALIISAYFTRKALQQKEDFTDAQIDEFQAKADDFFSKWVELVGYDGVTNYIHMLGAGHVCYYLKKW